MCGIAGVYRLDGPASGEDEELVASLCNEMKHRGPDAQSVARNENVVLGHSRLAVIDLDVRANQPMSNAQREVWVTFNGEIYNYLELRGALQQCGRSFRTTSDTEVLIEGYQQWGIDGLVERIRGMYAFGLWDKKTGQMWLVRDRLGVKPLFYCRDGNAWLFCSEARPLYRVERPSAERIDRAALDFYLAFGYLPPNRSILSGMHKLAPATLLRISKEGTHCEAYWTLPSEIDGERETHAALDAIEERLDESVRLRLRSDVPLGSLLSGGLDSSLVSVLAAKGMAASLTTVTAWFSGALGGADERPLARSVAERIGANHHEVEIGSIDMREMPSLIRLAGEPLADPSLVPTASVCRAAKQHVKVALTGDGGDELFAGYPGVVATFWGQQLTRAVGISGARTLQKALAPLSDFAIARKANTLARYGSEEISSLYCALGGGFDSDARRRMYLDRAEGLPVDGTASTQVGEALRTLSDRESRAAAVMRLDFSLRLPGRFLTKIDVASNAHSLECRSPFLDHRLAELAFSLPMHSKMKWGRQKYLLRSLSSRLLPRRVAKGPKRGFSSDIGGWIRRDLVRALGPVQEWGVCGRNGLLRGSEVDRAFSASVATGAVEQAWILACIEMWWREFVDNPRGGFEWGSPLQSSEVDI